MRKVYIKRAVINEDVTITDPTLAQQYLAVKKQMSDKRTKRDQIMKNVNQIDNEINILEKNLIAIEQKANVATTEKTTEKPAENKEQDTSAQNQQTPKTNESNSSVLQPKTGSELPTLDDYRESVISAIDEIYHDGETLAYSYVDVVEEGFELHESPEELAQTIVNMEKNRQEYQLDDSYIGGDNMGKFEENRSTPIRVEENVNESVYSDILKNIEDEISKLTSIKDFVEQFDNKEETNVDIDININTEEKGEELPLIPVKDDEEEVETPPLDLTQFKSPGISTREIDNDINFPSLEDKDYDVIDTEVDNEYTFEPSEDDRIVDETLKAENKGKYVPNLFEDDEEMEAQLDLMNYEDEDEPTDEYCFHVKINPEEDTEIIAKFYKDNEDDNWTVRVVRGDEEPLQSMEFDNRLDKLEIIGYLADMYDEIEIIDPKEYEYLLDDKEKVDNEYYDVNK